MNFSGLNKAIAICALTGMGSTALAASADTLPEEKRGAVIGGILGAGVGGPFGAGVGAILGGGLVGKAVGVQRINREMAADLASLKTKGAAERGQLRRQVRSLERALASAQESAQVTTKPPALPIQFRTASSGLEPHYQAELSQVAAAVTQHPGVTVKLEGYADRRGAEDYNLTLSQQRVDAVKEFLVAQGVPEAQIATHAYGETMPVNIEATPEDHFFDRRVVLQVTVNDMPVASR